MAQEQFKIDGVIIKAPDTYKPVFATTSTESSKRESGFSYAQHTNGNHCRI